MAATEEYESARAIPLTDEQLEFLKKEKEQHLPELFLFSNDKIPIDARVLRHYTESMFKMLGIKSHQFKDLRHSFAVRCLESGCDLVTLGALLGTESYTDSWQILY